MAEGTSILELAQRGDLSTLRTILGNTTSAKAFGLVSVSDDKGFTPLHWSCYFDEGDCCEVLLSLGHSDMAQRTTRGCTALHIASVAGSLRALPVLLSRPQAAHALDVSNEWGETALHLSSAARNVVVVKLLLEAGASASVKDRWGRTPLDVCVQHGSYDELLAVFEEHGATASSFAPIPEAPAPVLHGTIVAELMARLQIPKVPTPDGSVTIERSIFSSAPVSGSIAVSSDGAVSSLLDGAVGAEAVHRAPVTSCAASTTRALSKLVEYPGDPSALTALLNDDTVDAGGKDMFGVTALMKFSAW